MLGMLIAMLVVAIGDVDLIFGVASGFLQVTHVPSKILDVVPDSIDVMVSLSHVLRHDVKLSDERRDRDASKQSGNCGRNLYH